MTRYTVNAMLVFHMAVTLEVTAGDEEDAEERAREIWQQFTVLDPNGHRIRPQPESTLADDIEEAP